MEIEVRLTRQEAWWLAIRPKTLGAGISPILIGSTLAYSVGQFHLISALCCFICVLFLQIGTNLANDYFDFKNGADTDERVGPVRMTQSGIIKSEDMAKGVIFAFSIVLLLSSYLIARGGWPVGAITVFSILAGVFYTGGPFPYGYYGLGDLFVFLFFGLVGVSGTYFVQTLTLTVDVLAIGAIPGLLSVAILTVNNYRDKETDLKAGKYTIAVIMGARWTRLQYVFCLLLPSLLPLFFGFESHMIWTSLMSLPALLLIKRIYQLEGSALNGLLASTGLFVIVYTFVFCATYLWR